MDFWIFMFIIVLVIPIAMIGIGLLFIYKPPKQINSLYGYRTSMSKKNQETWDFAHQYCGKLWWILGKQLLIFSIVPMIFVYGYEDNIVETVGGFVIAFQSILMCCSIIPVEIALRKNFDKDGHRKETISTKDESGDDNKKISVESGSIDCLTIQRNIIEIMEGGEEAFKNRKMIYDVWNKQIKKS